MLEPRPAASGWEVDYTLDHHATMHAHSSVLVCVQKSRLLRPFQLFLVHLHMRSHIMQNVSDPSFCNLRKLHIVPDDVIFLHVLAAVLLKSILGASQMPPCYVLLWPDLRLIAEIQPIICKGPPPCFTVAHRHSLLYCFWGLWWINYLLLHPNNLWNMCLFLSFTLSSYLLSPIRLCCFIHVWICMKIQLEDTGLVWWLTFWMLLWSQYTFIQLWQVCILSLSTLIFYYKPVLQLS